MRLLHVSLRSMLLYALMLVLVSIPVSFYTIRAMIQEEVDESLQLYRDEFIQHIKNFEYLDDLEVDLQVMDQLSHDVNISPGQQPGPPEYFQTVYVYDTPAKEENPFRELTANIFVKGHPYVLKVRMSLIATEELASAIVGVQAVLILLLVAGLLFINRSLSKRLWQPFYKTLSKLKVYQVDKNQSFEYESSNIDEFDDLNTTVQHLTSKNKMFFEQQKEFIENASHELQTPLAIFQSKLDMLMQQSGLTETQAGIIGELASSTQRMARLNRNILLLSKIENEQFSDIETIAVDKIIQEQLSQILPLIQTRNIKVSCDAEPTKIEANKSLIEILIQNLLTNAKRHGTAGGEINIVLKGHKLTVSNTGPPLKDPASIFDRFTKESSVFQSSGLGLAIVNKICNTSHYRMEYYYHDGFHFFSVQF